LIWLALLAIVSSVYSYWSDYRDRLDALARERMAPAAGDWCRVWLLGGHSQVPPQAPLAVAEGDGAANSVRGTAPPPDVEGPFQRMNAEWIVLGRGPEATTQWWIPRSRILALECRSPN
jgi:hypothetical protein